MKSAAAVLMSLVLLAGCATMTDDECRKADWQTVGRRDGEDGRNDRWLDAHRKACSKAGVVPDQRLWLRGWADGVQRFCVPHRAWRLGLGDSSYSGACRDHSEAQFLRHYEAGRVAYRARKDKEDKEKQIADAEEQLKKATRDDERKTLRNRIRDLDSDLIALRRKLDRALAEEPR